MLSPTRRWVSFHGGPTLEQGVYWADIAFPILSFLLTIVSPSLVAVWVIVRVIMNVRGALPAGKDGASAKR